MAVFGVGNLLGPLISSMLSATAAAYAACGTRLACVAYAMLMIPSRLLTAAESDVSTALRLSHAIAARTGKPTCL